MIRISMTVLRDVALTAGALGVAGMALQELDRVTRPADTTLPPTRHGWLWALDGQTTDRPRRLRPATEAEAAASAASRRLGNGGWIAIAGGREVLALTDPAVLARAGQYTYDHASRVQIVHVDDTAPTGPLPARIADAARRHRAATEAWVARMLGPADAAPVTGVDELLDEADVLVQGALDDVDPDGLEDDGELYAGDIDGPDDGTDHTDVPAGETAADYADSSS
ncbi:hypothetical protein [Frankia sp. ACN1ag]|uniref:hypothetical protein n=1 Tax=Frankia sp. ACN1ag TaxID=102891 RepID=UPI0006DBFD9D|nr:hypothetical protein [Frankia sp. ACN1ag]KQC35040.1 hypothetical protein UK82_28685 [Frankia sp. ACN1ag]